MKLSGVLILVGILTGINAFAQIGVGAKGGWNYSKQTMAGADYRSGYHLGVFANKKLSQNYSLQAEILYSQQGATLNSYDLGISVINLPLIVKYNHNDIFNLYLGGQLGYITSISGRADHNEDVYAQMEVSSVGGIEFNLPFNLLAGGRYCHGYTDIWNNPDWPAESRSRVAQLYLGYKFNNR